MLTAIDTETDEKVMAKNVPTTYDEDVEKGRFVCPHPDCEGMMFPKKGQERIDHFAHYSDTMNIDHNWWEPETERHMKMKKDMRDFFSKFNTVSFIELEVGLDNTIPDLLVTLQEDFNFDVECQHSNISLNKINMRTGNLVSEKEVDGVIWILDKESFPKWNDFWYYSDHLDFNNRQRKIEKGELYDSSKYGLFDEKRNISSSGGYFSINKPLRTVLGLKKQNAVFLSKSEYLNVKDKHRRKIRERLSDFIVEGDKFRTSALVEIFFHHISDFIVQKPASYERRFYYCESDMEVIVRFLLEEGKMDIYLTKFRFDDSIATTESETFLFKSDIGAEEIIK